MPQLNIEKKDVSEGESGIFTRTLIPQGTIVFSNASWIEDEKLGWQTITVAELEQMPEEERTQFLRYSYDVDFGKIIGTSDYRKARNLSNYMNHNCKPNLQFDQFDNVVARRDILPGEELFIDYGNFIVNVDQDFECCCGSDNCRRFIRKDDWKFLAKEFGYGFPSFMHRELAKILATVQSGVI